ncbi:MAG: J domain-containing protein [Candidatus Methanofastidiosia archaeon]|jgi:hypothetical protein
MDINTAAKVLGVSIDATEREIKTKFRSLAKKYHPDLNSDKKGAEKKFKMYLEAYKILMNYDGDRHGFKTNTENSKKQGDKKNYNGSNNHSQRGKEAFNILPKWLMVLIGIIVLDRLFKKGIIGKLLMVILILVCMPLLFIPFFLAYMIPQVGIELDIIILIGKIIIGLVVFGMVWKKMYESAQIHKKTVPPKGERTYPKDVIKTAKGRHYKAIVTYVCGHCGQKNTVFSYSLHFIAECEYCGTENVIKLKRKREKKKEEVDILSFILKKLKKREYLMDASPIKFIICHKC